MTCWGGIFVFPGGVRGGCIEVLGSGMGLSKVPPHPLVTEDVLDLLSSGMGASEIPSAIRSFPSPFANSGDLSPSDAGFEDEESPV